jgi:hypothetical protein
VTVQAQQAVEEQRQFVGGASGARLCASRLAWLAV